MKTLYYCIPGLNDQQEMREFDVPDDVVPFGLGAECPACPGRFVTSINGVTMRYRCSVGVVSEDFTEHPIPARTAEVDHHGHVRVVCW